MDGKVVLRVRTALAGRSRATRCASPIRTGSTCSTPTWPAWSSRSRRAATATSTATTARISARRPTVDFPVDYQARDFWSMRTALLDFASQRYPRWADRLEADAAVMLVEVMSALGDDLAYHQDRVAREAHLETATQRRSLRRHARLVDYRIHDGLGAATWINVTAKAEGRFPPEPRCARSGRHPGRLLGRPRARRDTGRTKYDVDPRSTTPSSSPTSGTAVTFACRPARPRCSSRRHGRQ